MTPTKHDHTATAAFSKVAVTMQDLFPAGVYHHQIGTHSQRLEELIRSLTKTGISRLYVIDTWGGNELANAAIKNLSSDFQRTIQIVKWSKCKKSLASANHFTELLTNHTFPDFKHQYEVIPDFVDSARRSIFYFYVALELQLQIPSRSSYYKSTISRVVDLARNGPEKSRLEKFESVFNNYDEISIPTITTNHEGWDFVKKVHKENCNSYTNAFQKLGSTLFHAKAIETMDKAVKFMNNPLVKIISIPIDMFSSGSAATARTLMESILEFSSSQSSKFNHENFRPQFIRELNPLNTHYRNCHQDLESSAKAIMDGARKGSRNLN